MTDQIPASCGACDRPGTHGWQRYATATELEDARNDPDNPAVQRFDGSATIQVFACENDAIDPDLAVHTHDADCAAPPTCGCSVRIAYGADA